MTRFIFYISLFIGLPSIGQATVTTEIDFYQRKAKELAYEKPDSAKIYIRMAANLFRENVSFIQLGSGQDQAQFQKIEWIVRHLKQLHLEAYMYETQGDYNEALNRYFKQLKVCELYEEKLGNEFLEIEREKGIALANIGGVYLELSEPRRALEYYFKSNLVFGSRKELESSLAVNYSNIAALYEKQSIIDSALVYYDKAIKTASENGDSSLLALNYGNKAISLMNNQHYAESQKELNRAIKITSRLGNYPSLAYKYGNLGYLYFLKGEFDSAEVYYLKGLSLADKYSLDNLKKDQLLNLSILCDTLDRVREAFKYFKQYIDIKDALLNKENIREQTLVEAKYEFDKIEEENRSKQEKEKLKILEKERRVRLIAISLILGLVILILVFLLIYRAQKLKNEKVAIEADNKRLEIEYRLLRSQMNPHFLFNALNTINSFIVNDQNEKASSALQKFSTLVRKLLSQSTKTSIILEEELEMVREYIEIESIRFSDQFAYSIEIDGNVPSDGIRIPGMLLQPFVENAIIHGLAPKEGPGKLEIHTSIGKEEGTLEVIIRDNGVGRRVKGKPINKTHDSMSTRLIEERLDLLRGRTGSIEIRDMEEGTEVHLIIPFEEEF